MLMRPTLNQFLRKNLKKQTMKTIFLIILFITSFTFHLSAQEDIDEPLKKQEKELDGFQNLEWFQEDFSADIQSKMEEYMEKFQDKFGSYSEDFESHYRLDMNDMRKFEKIFEDFKIQFNDMDIPIDSIEQFFKDKQFNIDDFDVRKFHFDPWNEEKFEQFEEQMKWYFEDDEFKEKINEYKQRHKHQIEEILEKMKEHKTSMKKAI